VDSSYKDDVTIILPLAVFFMERDLETCSKKTDLASLRCFEANRRTVLSKTIGSSILYANSTANRIRKVKKIGTLKRNINLANRREGSDQ
jgi:hypothetical protein